MEIYHLFWIILLSHSSRNWGLETPGYFRPISLVNTVYKAISKILVSRLTPIPKREISLLHNAFTQDRSVHGNLLISQKILNTFHKSTNKIG